jgi:hypothetical protein
MVIVLEMGSLVTSVRIRMEGQYRIRRISGEVLHINIVTLAVQKGSGYRFCADASKILHRLYPNSGCGFTIQPIYYFV